MSGEFSREGHLAQLIALKTGISRLRAEASWPIDEEDECLDDAIERMEQERCRAEGLENEEDRLFNHIQGARWLVEIYGDGAYVRQIMRLNKLHLSSIYDHHAFWEWAFVHSC